MNSKYITFWNTTTEDYDKVDVRNNLEPEDLTLDYCASIAYFEGKGSLVNLDTCTDDEAEAYEASEEWELTNPVPDKFYYLNTRGMKLHDDREPVKCWLYNGTYELSEVDLGKDYFEDHNEEIEWVAKCAVEQQKGMYETVEELEAETIDEYDESEEWLYVDLSGYDLPNIYFNILYFKFPEQAN